MFHDAEWVGKAPNSASANISLRKAQFLRVTAQVWGVTQYTYGSEFPP